PDHDPEQVEADLAVGQLGGSRAAPVGGTGPSRAAGQPEGGGGARERGGGVQASSMMHGTASSSREPVALNLRVGGFPAVNGLFRLDDDVASAVRVGPGYRPTIGPRHEASPACSNAMGERDPHGLLLVWGELVAVVVRDFEHVGRPAAART